ncbi:hypothetical protein [Fontivita pretiosa]|uniref:hypothetical protein n=1 Tax=Fontivita pretiosa TaxID=2989684 RepID=UPI003D1855C2
MVMMAPDEPRFVCQACGRWYRWQPALAGRLARCRCGREIRVPHSPPPAGQENLIPLAEPSQTQPRTTAQQPRHAAALPGASHPEMYDQSTPVMAPGSPAPAQAGEGAGDRSAGVAPTAAPHRAVPLEYRRPGAAAPEPLAVDRLFPDRVKDLYLPATLIGLGVVVRLAYYLLWLGGTTRGATSVLSDIALEMVLGSAVLLVTILIAGKLRQIDFGPLPVAVFKLFAIVLGPTGVALLAAPLFIWIPLAGGLIYWIVEFCLYFAFLGALFDLDQSDTWYCVMVAFLVRIAIYFGLLVLR